MTLDVASPCALDPDTVAAWAGLQAARPDLQSPFLSPGWAMAVARAQGPGRTRVVLAREDGVLAAVLAAGVGRVTAWPIGAPLCDVQALVCRTGFACDPRDLVRALGVQRYDFTHLVGAGSPLAAGAAGGDVSYVTDLTEGHAAWVASRKASGSSLIKDLGKRRRKLERSFGPVRFTALSRDRADLKTLIAWKRRKFAETRQTDIFATGWTLALIEQLFEDSAQPPAPGDVRVGLFTLHAGDRLIAAHLHLMSETVIQGWLVAHDAEAEACSPGLLMFGDLLQWMDGRYRELDNGPVDYGFKTRLANEQRPIAHGFVAGPTPAGLARGAAWGLRRAAEGLPLGRASAWPGKAMRRLDLWRTLHGGGAGPRARPIDVEAPPQPPA